MNKRQEMLDAVNRKLPAHTPFTFEATKECQERLRKHLGLQGNIDLGDYFGCHKFASIWGGLGAGPNLPERTAKMPAPTETVRYNIWGVRQEYMQAGNAWYWEITEYPLAKCETVAEIEKFDWPRPDEVVWPEIPADFNLEKWRQDKVVLDMAFIGPFGLPWMMRGMEQLMLDLYENPGIVDAIVAKVEEYSLTCLGRMLEKYKGMVDLVGSGDDYGTQMSLFVSPELIRKHFMPSLKRHYDLAESFGVKGYHHSCGSVYHIIPDMIEAGMNVLNPIQTTAADMEPSRLKKEFGKHLCFHGGVDTQHTMTEGTPADVKNEVKRLIGQLGPNGYIVAPGHVLQADVPPENIVAMYEMTKELQK